MTAHIPLSGLRAEARREEIDGAFDFARIARAIMATKNLHEASAFAEATNQPARVQRILKAAVSAGTVGAVGPTVTELLRSFIATSRYPGAFDRVLAGAFRVPLTTRRVSIFTSVSASAVNEGAGKPVRRLQLSSTDFSPTKTTAQIVMSKELVLALTNEGLNSLARELRASVIIGSDTALLSALSGSESEAMGANSWSGFLDDLGEALRLLQLGAGSRVVAVVTSENMKAIAMAALANGVTTLGWDGGVTGSVEFVISEAQTADRLTLVDASALAIADGGVDLRSSTQATLQMDDAPSGESTTPTASNLVSLFQNRFALLTRGEIIQHRSG
jgi:hypothetical protein